MTSTWVEIGVTKKLPQRFQRDDFAMRRNGHTPGAFALLVENCSGGGGRNDFRALRATISCVRTGPLPPNLPALEPLARPDFENRAR
jgi:hypothetical protein